jgi:hypothetical protein
MTTEQSAALVQATDSAAMTVLDVISRAVKDPAFDVEKMERLLAMQERLLADQRRTAFSAALARLQEKMPQIVKTGTILGRDREVRSKYAKLEDIDAQVRPLLAEEGFAVAYDSKRVKDGIEFSCELSHREGYSTTKTMELPVDNHPSRNAVQSVGSTTSYARRYLLSLHLNLVTCDEDDDGQSAGVNRERPATVEPDRTDWRALIAAAESLSALNAVVGKLKASMESGRTPTSEANDMARLAKLRKSELSKPAADDGSREPGID